MVEQTNESILAMQISSGLSMFASFLVMLTIYKIKGFDKVFLKSVFYISFSDFFASLGTVIGGTKSDSAACYFQGIISNYFELTSFFWTFMTAYQVYLIVFYNRNDKDMKLQWVGWILPIAFTLLPLTTSTYANDDGTAGWCYISTNAPKGQPFLPLFWFLFSFFFWLWLVFIFIIFIICAVGYKLFYQQINSAAKPVVLRLIGYPIILFISWVIPSIIDIDAAVGGALNQGDPAFTVSTAYVLPTIQGVLNALYFFSVNGHYFTALMSLKEEDNLTLLVRDTMRHSDYDESVVSQAMHRSFIAENTNTTYSGLVFKDIINSVELRMNSDLGILTSDSNYENSAPSNTMSSNQFGTTPRVSNVTTRVSNVTIQLMNSKHNSQNLSTVDHYSQNLSTIDGAYTNDQTSNV